ncbi:hypothetical protein FHS29_005526 [Saccharothrix tamanrassetensis]|uniref:Uncharacterized protein n=1 Tax=Saccharothrix tamanrassetensis TaxID=1051531 RepID=A0A841CSA2_9PSEU|nr:hypothetical protein [Saccharothrix tamanrassetensis]MBB5958917.1 hypothetical protein [Saccharothrix tamanrassetensis]
MQLPPAWQRPDPLRGLERVSWTRLSRGTGVNGLLRRTAEGDLDACAALERRLLDDDTVSEASVRAVPFLVELGANYKVPGAVRDRVIFLLAGLALASAGFTYEGRRTRRRWNPVGRELPRLPPDWITQTRYAVAKGAPRVFDALAGAEVACAVALAIAVPEVAPKHVVDVVENIAYAGTHPPLLVEAACVALHLLLGESTDERRVRAIAQGDPDLLHAYDTGGYPPHQPPVVTAQLMGYRFAVMAAYG